MVVLVDSNVWIRREHDRLTLAELLSEDTDVAICPVIFSEVLRGVRGPKRYRETRSLLMDARFFDSPTPLERFEEAAQIYLRCRQEGVTPSSIDCLIAACAIAHDIPLLTFDADFTHIARYTALRLFTRS